MVCANADGAWTGQEPVQAQLPTLPGQSGCGRLSTSPWRVLGFRRGIRVKKIHARAVSERRER